MSETDAQVEETVEINTLLGRGSHFDGKLTFQGAVRIDGEFSGEIFSDDILVVGEGGHITAEVEIGSLVIEGVVEGNILAKRSVEIHAPGTVRGNITTPSLFIDRGVVFEGNCQMYELEDGPPSGAQTITADPPPDDDDSDNESEVDETMGNTETSGTIDS